MEKLDSDGQHRVTALQNIMYNDAKFDCDSIIELYEVESFEDEEATKLFLDANNTLNIIKKIQILTYKKCYDIL